MQQANPHLFVQYDQWIQQQLARVVQRVLSMPEIHHIVYNVQVVLQRDVQNALYLMLEYNFSNNGIINWNTNDAESLIVVAVEALTYNEAISNNINIPAFVDSYNYLCNTLQSIELKSQQQWQPPVSPGFNSPAVLPHWNQPQQQQWANRVPVQQQHTIGGGMPQQFVNNLPQQFTNNLPQNNMQPPIPGAVWDERQRFWILPAVPQQPLNAQVGSGFVHYPPQHQRPPANSNLQTGSLSTLAAESVMREQDHLLPSATLHNVNPRNYDFQSPEPPKPLYTNTRVGQPDAETPVSPKPTANRVYVNTQLTDSRKTTVMPIDETELAMGLADLTKELKEPVLIEINNIKRVTYAGHSYTASTPQETLVELKTKLHEFTLVTEVPQIIKLVGELKDDFEAKHLADLVCSKVKNTVEVGMMYRYSDTEYKSLPYIEFYKEVGGLFTAIGVKDDLDQCVVHMIKNMFITTTLVPYVEDVEYGEDNPEIELLSSELKVPVKDHIDLIILDIPTTTLVLPWTTSYTQSSHKLTVKVGDDVINNLFHQAFSLLPAQILFIDMYDILHKRYRVYRYGPKMLTGSIYHIEKFIE